MQDLVKNQKNTKSQNKISKIFEKSVDPGSLVFSKFHPCKFVFKL